MKFKCVVLALLFCGVAACSTPAPVAKETPQTVVPYWIDGIICVSSRMVEKNRYWLAKYKAGNATTADLLWVIESNMRYHQGMIGRMEAAKEEAAAARLVMEEENE